MVGLELTSLPYCTDIYDKEVEVLVTQLQERIESLSGTFFGDFDHLLCLPLGRSKNAGKDRFFHCIKSFCSTCHLTIFVACYCLIPIAFLFFIWTEIQISVFGEIQFLYLKCYSFSLWVL